MGIHLMLGGHSAGSAELLQPNTVLDRVALLEKKLDAMTKAFLAARRSLLKKNTEEEVGEDIINPNENKDGLPYNTCYIGISRGIPYILTINAVGQYIVADKVFNTLSAAAEAVSGVRRSGWAFWKLLDGRSIKDVYRK
ncbi:MAG TPA: DUF4357 domain-containing protein [Patescibacteria group bacterium]|nr:DUF4357 domain-containing protein [Patescibacteria group bacterium]